MLRNPILKTIARAVLCGVFVYVWAVLPARAVSLEWTRQFGSSSLEYDISVSADALANVYVSGITRGSLGGPIAAGDEDAFLTKYDAAGSPQWTKQFGTVGTDGGQGVSADGLGNVYITGRTEGSLGGPNAGRTDAFVAKYDAAGNLLWSKQFGTSNDDYGDAVSADGLGNVYVSVATGGNLGSANAGNYDAYIAKYDAAGLVLWTKQLGTSVEEGSNGVSADGLGNVYISGVTFGGSLGGPNAGGADAFVAKYDAAGILQWTKQLGTSADDYGNGVSADGLGNVYISGITYGSGLGGPSAGQTDAFLAKYDAAGSIQWVKQLGTSGIENGPGVSADGLGSVYLAGVTTGNLGGPSAGGRDAYVAKYDAAGNLQWTQQRGTSADDSGNSVSADGLGNVYISGNTGGSLGGPNAGVDDGFVAKFADVPEPSPLLLSYLALLSLAWQRGARSRR